MATNAELLQEEKALLLKKKALLEGAKPTLEERLAKLQKGTLEERLAKLQAENPFQAELDSRNPFETELSRRSETAGSAFADAASQEFINNLLGFPQATGTALAFTAALPALVLGGETFREQFETEKGRFPASMLRAIPRPTAGGVVAGIRSLPALLPGGETFSERKQIELDRFRAERGRLKEKFPKATGAGEIGGDVATLLTGRLPFARRINKLETKLFGKRPDLLFGGAVPKITDPGIRRLVGDVITSPAMKSLARGAGRSLEAGFEAATLDLLKGDDPLETAVFVATAQAGGSVFLSISKGLLSGGPLKIGSKLALSAVSAGALIQLVKETTPGGQDNLIDSIETGFEKVMYALAFGALAAVVGAGRLRGGKRAADIPEVMDAITAIPRLSMISLLEGWKNADPVEQQTIELVINKLAKDPEFFGKGAAAKLQSAITNNRFAEELRALQKNRTFKQKLFSLAPPKHLFPEQRQ